MIKDGDYLVAQWRTRQTLLNKAWEWVIYTLDPLQLALRLREERN